MTFIARVLASAAASVLASCAGFTPAGPQMILGFNGPERFERELAADPTLRACVESNGMPDYFDESMVPRNLRLVYIDRDMVVTRSESPTGPRLAASFGIPEDLLRHLSSADRARAAQAGQQRLQRAAREMSAAPKISEELKRKAEAALLTEPSDALIVWNRYYRPEPRGEFEPREQYEARLAPLDPEALFFFEVSPETQYDIDHGTMNVTLTLSECLSLEMLSGYYLTLRDDTVQAAKVGANAFGRESSYIETTGTEYQGIVTNLDVFAAACGLGLQPKTLGRELRLSFAMPADIAQKVKDGLKVQVGMSFPSSEQAEEYTLAVGARVDRPWASYIQQNYMAARLRTLIVHDASSKVWASFAGR